MVFLSSTSSAAPELDWRDAGRDGAGGPGVGVGLEDRIVQRSGSALSALFSAASNAGLLLASLGWRRHQGGSGYFSGRGPLEEKLEPLQQPPVARAGIVVVCTQET